jgi:hypothetical protein
MPTQQTISQYYEITSAGEGGDDENLYIRVEITKGPLALSGATEAQILGFVKNYLQSLSQNPINAARVQTIRTEGL